MMSWQKNKQTLVLLNFKQKLKSVTTYSYHTHDNGTFHFCDGCMSLKVTARHACNIYTPLRPSMGRANPTTPIRIYVTTAFPFFF